MASVELYKTRLMLLSSLKAYYRFEDDALTTDSSGNGHTGTAISDPAEDASGKFGGAVALDGNDAYSYTDHDDFKPTGNFTIGGWIKTSTTGATQSIFGSWYSDNLSTFFNGIQLRISTTNKAAFVSAKGGGTTLGTHYKVITGGTTITDGAYHFVVATWDGSYLRLYVDGDSDATAVSWANAPVYHASNAVRVGCLYTGAGNSQFFTGSLDDVFLLNGTDLSAEEVLGIFDGSIKTPIKSLSEILAISEVKSKKITKNITENLTITETFNRIATFIRTFLENSIITPVISKKPVKVISNNLGVSDVFSRTYTSIRSFAENLAISEVKSISRLLIKTFTENVAISETFSRVATLVRTFTENLAITENLSKIATLIRSFTENLAITEAVAKFRLYRVALTENLAISEVMEKVVTFVRTFTENISIDESIASIKTYTRSLTENLAITESLSKLKTNFRAFTENLAITEVISKTLRQFAHNIIGKISSMEITGKTKQMYIKGKIK
jgi:sulfur relay (sulfurtransferase) DsrC/TusE family protein